MNQVRNQIIEWAIKLQREGVKGEGEEFTVAEKVRAKEVTQSIHIEHLHGPLSAIGNIQDQAEVTIFQNMEYSSNDLEGIRNLVGEIEAHKNQIGLKPDDLRKLEVSVQGLKEALAKRDPDSGIIRKTLGTVREVVVNAAGGVIAEGIIKIIGTYIQ